MFALSLWTRHAPASSVIRITSIGAATETPTDEEAVQRPSSSLSPGRRDSAPRQKSSDSRALSVAVRAL